MSKPFGIYASTDFEGVWERLTSYKTMKAANQALDSLTAKPKEKRKVRYIIFPNDSNNQNRYLAIKPEHTQQLYDGAR